MSNVELTPQERLTLAIERIARELGTVGIDPEVVEGLHAALSAEDVGFAEGLAKSLAA